MQQLQKNSPFLQPNGTKYYKTPPIQRDMRQNMMSRYKPSYTKGIPAIPSPILHGLHLHDPWLGSERSQVQNQDKTSQLFFLLPPPSIYYSLPSYRKNNRGSYMVNPSLFLLLDWIHSRLHTKILIITCRTITVLLLY